MTEGHKSARLEGIHNSTCEDDESFNEPNREQYFLRLIQLDRHLRGSPRAC